MISCLSLCKMLTFVLIFDTFIPSEVRLYLPKALILPPYFLDITHLHLPGAFLHLQTFPCTGSLPSREKTYSFNPVPSSEYSPSPLQGAYIPPASISSPFFHSSSPVHSGFRCITAFSLLLPKKPMSTLVLAPVVTLYSLFSLTHPEHLILLTSPLLKHSLLWLSLSWFSSRHSYVDSSVFYPWLSSLSFHTISCYFSYHLYYQPTPLSQAPDPWNPLLLNIPTCPTGTPIRQVQKWTHHPPPGPPNPGLNICMAFTYTSHPGLSSFPHVHIKFLIKSILPPQSRFQWHCLNPDPQRLSTRFLQ